MLIQVFLLSVRRFGSLAAVLSPQFKLTSKFVGFTKFVQGSQLDLEVGTSMSYEEDILVELRGRDLEELAHMYEPHKNDLPHICSFLRLCVESKKIGMVEFVTVLSPRNCWREDGTFIASMPHHGHDIVLHSLDPAGKFLIEGLAKTNRFKYLKDPERDFTLFYAVHEQFAAKVLEVLTGVLKQELMRLDELNAWCLDRDNSLKRDIIEPPDVYVKELESEDVPILNSVWPFRDPTSDLKFYDLLKLCKGYGVYLKSNNQLVSWVAPSPLGQMTALQTLDNHKKKGYGTLAVLNMAKYLAGNGFDCFGTVLYENTASEALLTKLGFTKRFMCQYFCIHNKNN